VWGEPGERERGNWVLNETEFVGTVALQSGVDKRRTP
jgi:hypothetical protein